MPHSYVVKKTARQSLRNNWLKSIIVCVVFLATYFFESFLVRTVVEVISTGLFLGEGVVLNSISIWLDVILNAFLVTPLALGVFRYFWRLTDLTEVSIGELFYYFSSKNLYIRSLKTFCAVFSRLFVIVFVCLLPYIIISILTSSEFYSALGVHLPDSIFSIGLVNNWLFIIGVAISVFYICKYFLVIPIIVANEETKINKAFELSKKVAKGKIGNFLTFLLSFSGWLLLSLLAFPVVFTLPYFLASYAVCSRFTITNNNLQAESENNNYYQQNI